MDDIIIDVVKTEEQEDGSLLVTLDINEKGIRYIIQEWLNSILKKHMEDLIDEGDACD